MKELKHVLIIGAGSMAKDLADLTKDIPGYQVAGFVIDQPPYIPDTQIGGMPIIWIDTLEDLDKTLNAICAFSSMNRIETIKKVKSFGINFIHLIHPSSRVSSLVTVGEGAVINSGVHIAADSALGDFVYVNRGALIGHDTVIGNFSVIAPGVNIAGNVDIGEKTYLGMGSIITERVSIGEGCFICAGSLVTKDIPDRVKVIGSPARIIERDIGDY